MFDGNAIWFEVGIALSGFVFGAFVYLFFNRFLDTKPKKDKLYLVIFAICFAGFTFLISLSNLNEIIMFSIALVISAFVLSAGAKSKMKPIKSIITTVIAFLIPLSVMYLSLAIISFIIGLINNQIDLTVDIFMSIPVQIGFNFLIYHFPAIKRSAEVFTKDFRITANVLLPVLSFGAFTYLIHTFDFAGAHVGLYLALVGMALVALVSFLALLAWVMAPSKKKPLREVFNRFGFFGYEGGKFLYSLIMGVLENRFESENLNDIFPILAEEYNKTLTPEEKQKSAKNVEANMRDAIKAVWTTASEDILNELYKGLIGKDKDWPTITQFYMHYVETYRDEKK